MPQAVDRDYIEHLPKAELHLHLEGSVRPRLLKELASRQGSSLAGLEEEEIRSRLFDFPDFYTFLDAYRVVCEHLLTPEDYVLVLRELGAELQRQNVVYAEIIVSPAIAWKAGRDARAILAALVEESARLEASAGLTIRWILDCVRQFGAEWAWKTARLGREYRRRGVVALGLGGDEKSLPMEEYRQVFAWARAHQLFAHVHAGEVGEADQVWGAVRLLGARRIGHGIQAARDSRLMTYLKEHAVTLDVCLTSNLKTGAWRPISQNPFGMLYRRGVPVTLSTDDPALFETSLNRELEQAVHCFQLDREELNRLILQSVHSAFLPQAKKMALMRSFQEAILELRAPERAP